MQRVPPWASACTATTPPPPLAESELMQTFVPYGRNFEYNALCLDDKRLGKQRVEAWQILRALRGETKGWRNHPATRMWEGHAGPLAHYGWWMCYIWHRRGFQDSLSKKFIFSTEWQTWDGNTIPSWLDNPEVMESHQSNLLRKNPDHYGWYGWEVPDDLPYVWPVKDLGWTPDQKVTF